MARGIIETVIATVMIPIALETRMRFMGGIYVSSAKNHSGPEFEAIPGRTVQFAMRAFKALVE